MKPIQLSEDDYSQLQEYAERRAEVTKLEERDKASSENYFQLDDMARDFMIDLCERAGLELE